MKFFVPGTPAPQGSKSAYKRGNKIVLVESSKKVKPWREQVALYAREHCGTHPYPKETALIVSIAFHMPRPKNLRAGEEFMTVRPDLDKLVRSTLDGMTGVVFEDDSQIVQVNAMKDRNNPLQEPGAHISIEVANSECMEQLFRRCA